MGDKCTNCAFYDIESTGLPVCTLHKRYMHGDWTCGDFESTYERREKGESDGRTQDTQA